MISKTLGLLMVLAAGAVIVTGWPDIQRYLKIRQVSGEPGHPEKVPAEGRRAYPQHHDAGVDDGTGDFDSARRGGGPVTKTAR